MHKNTEYLLITEYFLLSSSVTESKHRDYIYIQITESIENDLSSPLKFATITSLHGILFATITNWSGWVWQIDMIDPNQLGRVWQVDVIDPNQLGGVWQVDVIGPNQLGRVWQVDVIGPNQLGWVWQGNPDILNSQ